MGGSLREVKKNRTRGQSVRPNLNSHGPRCPVQCPLYPGPPCTSEPVYTLWIYYNHILQEKQALFFELTAKKKPLLPLSWREDDIQIVSLPQLQYPTTYWLGENEQKMRGDKLERGVNIIFKPNERHENTDPLVEFPFLSKRSHSCNAKPLF